MNKIENFVRVTAIVVVGGIAAAAGFKHSIDWAHSNGQKGWVGVAVAVVIEYLALIAYLELRRSRGFAPALVLVGAFAMQMAAQVSSAPKTPTGWLLAATPCLGFLIIVKLTMRKVPAPAAPAARPSTVAAPTPLKVQAVVQRQEQPPTPRVEPEPAPQLRPAERPAAPVAPSVEVPTTPSMVWLPVAVRERVTTTVREVLLAGHPLTEDVLRSVPGLPPSDVTTLVSEINSAIH